VATTVANVSAYALALVAARRLLPDGWGALAALLGLLAIGNVAALAVQATVARRVAASSDSGGLGATAAVAAVGTALVAAAAAFPLTAFLHLGTVAGPLWVAAGLLPLVWLGALMGQAQGRERFGLLSALIVIGAVARNGAALSATGTGSYVTVVAAGAVGTAAAAVVATVLCRSAVPRWGRPSRTPLLEATQAGVAFLGVFLLTGMDLVLARHWLPAIDAGHYAAGSVLAKVAFWLPQAVGIIAFPFMSRAQDRAGATRAALAVVVGCGLTLTAGTALFGQVAIEAAAGPRYADMAGLAWVFTLTGAAFAVAQLLVLARIARRQRLAALPLYVAAVVEVLVVATWLHASPAEVVGAAAAVAVGLATALVAAELARAGRGARSAADASVAAA
jgi:O-antigen/teichoic acid export membrane protein